MYVRMTSKDSLKMDVAMVKTNHALPPLVPLCSSSCIIDWYYDLFGCPIGFALWEWIPMSHVVPTLE
uniref:Uncharacterized protein n=1 Tax=Salix viminalis TaxID=40686 RepID=A0A6N2K5C1_SALVM